MSSHRIISMVCLILCVALAQVGTAADPSLVGWWTFDDGSGATAKDSSGNGNDGTLIGDPTWGTEDGHAGILVLDGVDDRMVVTGNYVLPLYSMAVWFRIDAPGQQVLFGAYGANGELYGASLEIQSDGRLRYVHRFPFGSSGGTNLYTDTTYDDGQWYHVAIVKTLDAMILYINGKEVATAADNTQFDQTTLMLTISALRDDNPIRLVTGAMDDLQLYDRDLSAQEVQRAMLGLSQNQASVPTPEDGGNDVLRNAPLTWSPGEFAATHDVYFGTSFDDVNTATVPTAAGLDVNSFDPGRVEFGQTYFWRVDEVNGAPDNTVFRGNVWSFEVEPYSIPIPGTTITVTASSVSNDFSTPVKTIDGSGLDANDMHAIQPETMWFTAAVDLYPWIQYEFDTVKKLDTMAVWNANTAAEAAIGWGVKDVEIATSVDGETWNVLAEANQFSRAPGRPTYSAFDTVDFQGAAAKYVRLNIQSNWGGILMSYGLSEVQFSMIPVRARTPEPASGAVDLPPDTVATWRAGRDADHHVIYVSTDLNAVSEGTASSVTSSLASLDMTTLDLQLGQTYYWRVNEVNDTETVTLWAGDVWNLSTVPYLTIGDFEGYSNLSPDRPFQTWLDGFGYSADEFFPAGYGGNGTGAGIGHDIWSLSSPHYNGDIMETTNTLPGSGMSMPFYYTNTGGVASQTDRTFAEPQDWTMGAAQTLSIAFNGQAGNTGTMFVVINNEKLTYQRDNGNISRGVWQVWNIDLSTINGSLSNVSELTLGVEGAGASGMILFDDIRLYAEPGEVLTPQDPGMSGLVGAWSFDKGSGTVAFDRWGSARNGTITDATWDTGIQGSALNFNGTSAYVNIDGFKGINAVDAVQQAFTISNWIRTTAAEGEMVTWGTNAGRQRLTWRINEATLRTEHGAGNLRGNTPVNDDEWHHVALVVTEGANLTVPATQIYLDGVPDGTFGGSANPYELAPDVDVRIGMGGPTGDRFFTGLIDEVLIFDRALFDVELLWLAGRTEAIDRPF